LLAFAGVQVVWQDSIRISHSDSNSNSNSNSKSNSNSNSNSFSGRATEVAMSLLRGCDEHRATAHLAVCA
jgi:hypothetical protein